MSALPPGWTESKPGGLATNTDPIEGGIIDVAIVSDEWFVIFNADPLSPMEGFKTRDDAFAAWANVIEQSRAIYP